MLDAYSAGKVISQVPSMLKLAPSQHQQGISNDFSLCIDLIFCNNQNALTEYGIDASISDKSHHNIGICQINVCVSLPPRYVCKVWDKSNTITYSSIFSFFFFIIRFLLGELSFVQLFPIIHEIQTYCFLEYYCFFQDIFKTFNKVQHKVFFFKLKTDVSESLSL